MQLARSQGRVDVDGLALRFGVTPQTIRKDLNELCEAEMLHRVHGGAVYPSSTANYAYTSRRELAAEAKSKIAQLAASFVPNDSSLILNIGTTTEHVAAALAEHNGLLVVTNNLNVALILADARGIEVVIAGGMVRKSDLGIVEAAAIDMIEQFKVDIAVIGTSAIDEDGCLLDFDYREVRVAQAIMKQARKCILVADNMKFERRAPVQIGHLSDIDIFVTDLMPAPEIVDLCKRSGVQLQVTGERDPDAEAASASHVTEP
ncbi:MAG: DeoR/GlpR family DNA-binding transcription regulator [Gammaproteobacteria bacterium]|nr:DeoR/GlpR family DNA-binding transcription regulator [Gammaproteobacteria bacterium]